MLEMIKGMIARKQEFVESAKIIFEDVVESNIDSLIILGEEAEEIVEAEEGEDIQEEKDLMDQPLADEETDNSEEDTPVEGEDNDDLMNQPLGDEEGGDELPVPTEEVEVNKDDEINDFLNISLDLQSNTVSDILPIPPDNASDAISGNDDLMSTRIDTGFEEEPPSQLDDVEEPTEDNDDLMNQPLGDEEESVEPVEDNLGESVDDNDFLNTTISESSNKEECEEKDDTKDKKDKDKSKKEKPITEGISLAGDTAAPDTGAANDAEAGNPPVAQEESPVTAAVRDKVAEVDTGTSGEDGSSEGGDGKEEIMKKLSTMSKSLEDTKLIVMKYT